MIRSGKPGRRVLALSLSLALPGAAATLQAQDELALFIKVVDLTTGVAVTDLQPDEITILEDDQPLETVGVEVIDWPMKVMILLNNSRPTAQSLTRIENGLRELVAALPEAGQIELLTTAPQPRFLTRMTADRAEVHEGIGRLAPDPGGSAFVDALVEASDRIRDDEPHFSVVLIIAADGADPSGGMDRKIRRLQEQTFEQSVVHHFVLWTLPGIGQESNLVQAQIADQLSQVTGCRYESLAAIEGVTALLPEIGQQLAASYENQRDQLRVTFERQRTEPPQLGLGATVSRMGVRAILSLNGTMP